MWSRVEDGCEFLAYWLGGTTRPELSRLFGYSKRRITTLIDEGFARRGSATAAYAPNSKLWLSNAETKNLHGIKCPREVLTVLLAERALAGSGEPRFPCPVVETSAFRKDPNPEIFRLLVGACARRRPVQVDYSARTRRFAVLFSPHTIVRTAQRVHIRGYSMFPPNDKPAFWDLLPTRVLAAELGRKGDYVDGKADHEWHRSIEVRLILNPAVPPAMREAIRHEHGMKDDCLVLGPMPQPLAPYVISEYTHRRYEGYDAQAWSKQ